MPDFQETHLKCLLATAGAPVTSASPTSFDRRGPVIAAIYLPEATIHLDDGRIKNFPNGVFVSSMLDDATPRFNIPPGLNSIDLDDEFFEKNFRPCTLSGMPNGKPIDKVLRTEHMIKAANPLREAGFTTMPVIEAPHIPGRNASITAPQSIL